MAKSFPYILKSGAFKEVLAQDLGLQSVPGTIEAEVMENTNLFTLKVTANNPKMAEKILKAVVKNYPSVAEFVIGRCYIVWGIGKSLVSTEHCTTNHKNNQKSPFHLNDAFDQVIKQSSNIDQILFMFCF